MSELDQKPSQRQQEMAQPRKDLWVVLVPEEMTIQEMGGQKFGVGVGGWGKGDLVMLLFLDCEFC